MPGGVRAPSSLARPATTWPGPRASYIYLAGRNAARPAAFELGVFRASANGDVAPVRVISGSQTQLSNPKTAAVDSSGRIWTCSTSNRNVFAFAAGASGNVVPSVIIGGTNSPVERCGDVALSADGTIYASSFQVPPQSSAVAQWPAGYSGNVPPSHVLRGSKTGLGAAAALALDYGNDLFVSSVDPAEVEVFRGTIGNVAPLWRIAGPNTLLDNPYAIAIDPYTQELWVANDGSNLVESFITQATGNHAPRDTIAGSLTQIDHPRGLAIDRAGYIYVGNCPPSGGGSILVFAPKSTGNVKPVQAIEGANANLACVMQLTVK